jgi:predicted  nucleic acid-binding Zn-ribbon protein
MKKSVKIDIGMGEAADRSSILAIKSVMIKDAVKLKSVEKELERFKNELDSIAIVIKDLYEKLYSVNMKLWNVEDKLRILEKEKRFDGEFVKLARSVYHLNDERHKLKCEIDDRVGYNCKEQKEYVKYEKDINID